MQASFVSCPTRENLILNPPVALRLDNPLYIKWPGIEIFFISNLCTSLPGIWMCLGIKRLLITCLLNFSFVIFGSFLSFPLKILNKEQSFKDAPQTFYYIFFIFKHFTKWSMGKEIFWIGFVFESTLSKYKMAGSILQFVFVLCPKVVTHRKKDLAMLFIPLGIK